MDLTRYANDSQIMFICITEIADVRHVLAMRPEQVFLGEIVSFRNQSIYDHRQCTIDFLLTPRRRRSRTSSVQSTMQLKNFGLLFH